MRREQVALLFLTTGALFHERSWALWFSHAAGLLPLRSLLDDPGGAAKRPLFELAAPMSASLRQGYP